MKVVGIVNVDKQIALKNAFMGIEFHGAHINAVQF
jgi:hypothetical protein